MRQPVPTLNSPNFANPNQIPATDHRPISQIVDGTVAEALASAAVKEKRRAVEAVGALEDRYMQLKGVVLNEWPAEQLQAFPSTAGIEDLTPEVLANLETACEAVVESIVTRVAELDRDRAAKMTGEEKLWAVINAQGAQIQTLQNKVARLESGQAQLPAPSFAKAEVPQLLSPKKGAATAEAFGGSGPSGVRRIGR